MAHNSVEQAVLDSIEAHQDELFQILKDLIRVSSENFITRGNEAACADVVRGLYEDLGLKTEVYTPDDYLEGNPDYLAGRGTNLRPNVGGIYRGTEGSRSVMLAAHMDTVPIGDLGAWTMDPLGGEIKDGKIYGRGCGDNKFGIASGVFLLRTLKDLRIRLKQNVVLSAYCDEEFGGGNGSIASCVKYPCDMYINLDGGNSNREVWTCALGGQLLHAEIFAREPQDSAALIVDGLGVIRRKVEEFGKRRSDELQAHRFYQNSDMQRSALRILSFHCGEAGTNLSKGMLDFVFYTVKDKRKIESEIAGMEKEIASELDKMQIDFSAFTPASRYFEYGRTRTETLRRLPMAPGWAIRSEITFMEKSGPIYVPTLNTGMFLQTKTKELAFTRPSLKKSEAAERTLSILQRDGLDIRRLSIPALRNFKRTLWRRSVSSGRV